MRASKDIMGMPVTVEIVGGTALDLDVVFNYFADVDARFSTYKHDSEISKINRGELQPNEYSGDMQKIFALAEKTTLETGGFFSIIRPDGTIDPSGLVKGWAIREAAQRVSSMGYQHFFIDVGGDIQSDGYDSAGNPWTVGIRNPFNRTEVVKILQPNGHGVATSGTYIRGQHIYNPYDPTATLADIVSLTVVGPDIYEADRFATAAFAMESGGIRFIELIPGLEGYAINSKGIATMTSGFERYTTL